MPLFALIAQFQNLTPALFAFATAGIILAVGYTLKKLNSK